MSLFGKSDIPPAIDAKPKDTPPADPPVARSEFNALATQIGDLVASVRDLAARPVVVTAPQAATPPPPEVSDEEINAAFAEGKGADKVRQLVKQQVGAAAARGEAEVAALRSYGATTFESHAERLFVGGLELAERELFLRFEKDIKGLVNQCEAPLRGHPDTWQAAFDNVLGRNRKTLENERVESEIRRREAALSAPAPQPGRSGAAPADRGDVEGDVPDLRATAGEFSTMLGDMDEGEFIRRMNRGKRPYKGDVMKDVPVQDWFKYQYKDWTDYQRRRAVLESRLDDIHNGFDDGGEGPIPSSLQ